MAIVVRASSQDVDALFAGQNVFAACSRETRVELRELMDRRAATLQVLTLRAGTYRRIVPERGCLYCVLEGRVSLSWEGLGTRRLAFAVAGKGQLFGDTQCGVLDITYESPFFCAEPLFTRKVRTCKWLRCAPGTVSALLDNREFERRLAQTAMQSLLFTVDRLATQCLADPRMALAQLCLLPTCGSDVTVDRTITIMGQSVTIEKSITIDEIARLTGYAANTIRTALASLEDAGYIRTNADRLNGTQLTVVQPGLLLEHLHSGELTECA